MTYRELAEAINVMNELQREVEKYRMDKRRWNGTCEEQDEANARFHTADAALDQEIDS
jgi:hypothetical protein